jgi:hypothetical protein
MSLMSETQSILDRLGVSKDAYTSGSLRVVSPLTGEEIAAVVEIAPDDARKKFTQRISLSKGGVRYLLLAEVSLSDCWAKSSEQRKTI